VLEMLAIAGFSERHVGWINVKPSHALRGIEPPTSIVAEPTLRVDDWAGGCCTGAGPVLSPLAPQPFSATAARPINQHR